MMIFSIPINIVICLGLLTPTIFVETLKEGTTGDIILICFFSFLWGLGTYGFGMSGENDIR